MERVGPKYVVLNWERFLLGMVHAAERRSATPDSDFLRQSVPPHMTAFVAIIGKIILISKDELR